MMEALTDMECQDIPTMVWNNADQEAIVERLETGLKIYKDKTAKENHKKIMESTFSPIFKFVRTCDTVESYWHDKTIEGWMKEIWTKIRCGNFGKSNKKGYKSQYCRACESEPETLNLISCRQALNLCSKKIQSEIQTLTDGKYDADLDTLWRTLLRGPPISKDESYLK
ncbi:hypothetical protein KQX54_017410 [Cotesia glomerata]|uniref:Uncharacterized protein n=1 Tax=Cotesia glomerata TaxID=32391 RepID=A0AAV7J169_COTGL|nr:hypothetical protein KQX54_017410 [Cotesia glomerata]